MQTADAYTDLVKYLEALPGWETMTAYDRATRCCEELTRQGADLPSWLGIRQLIGKGSGQDINRAKADFRKHQVEAVRQLRGVVKGVPETLAPLLMTLWTTAIKEAGGEFEQKLAAITLSQQEAIAHAQQYAYEKKEALNQLHQAETELITVKTKLSQLLEDYAIETQLKTALERRCNELQDLQLEQSDRYRQAIEQAHYEMQSAISRLEGAEKHTLLEIERVKQEEALKLERAEARWQKKYHEHTVLHAQWEQRSETLNGEIQKLTEQNNALNHENTYLKERITHAEVQIARFEKNNAALLNSLDNLTASKKRNNNRIPKGIL